jgi:hypothetical protein
MCPYGKLPSIELLLEAAEELRVERLSPAALAEELALERVHGVDVVAGPRLVGGVGRGEIGIDARDVGVDVAEHRLALLALVLQRPGLPGHDGLGLGAGHEVLKAGDQPDGAQPGSVDGRDPGVETGLLEQQPTILGEDPARRLDPARVGLRVDVGDVEAVAQEGDAREGHRLLGRRAVGVDAELLGLEVSEEVVGGDVVEERRQRVVHLGLAGSLGTGHAVLAGRQDVPGDDGGVLGDGARARHQERQPDANGDQDTSHPEHLSSLLSRALP